MDAKRCKIIVKGIVQGVGFRPFVYRKAVEHNLSGYVKNIGEGVLVDVEGSQPLIEEFIKDLVNNPPVLAQITDVQTHWLEPQGLIGFSVGLSDSSNANTMIPPDISVCDACLRELFDPADRRYLYPFINCTDCGPRFTIIHYLPYDRNSTTMRVFPLCRDCESEYKNPLSRRFHAEPIACPSCGPRLWIADKQGIEQEFDNPIREIANRLRQGHIVAIKGIGGFHIAVDAENQDAVIQLRMIKQRDNKPFAVMALGIDEVKGFAYVSKEEERLLKRWEKPIVILRKKRPSTIAEAVAPNNTMIGVMLPYTPLHYLLLREGFLALVMTSANFHDEPIIKDNEEAISRLSHCVDCFLMHNRPILYRLDDSVAMISIDKPLLIRRGRGFTPIGHKIELAYNGASILACGGDIKNTFCITRGNQAFLSQHIGDLENAYTAEHFINTVIDLCKLLNSTPEVIVHDKHPDYFSTRLARRLSEEVFKGSKLVEVQHHHAHILSCMAENNYYDPVLGMAMDGGGWAGDLQIWGGEILLVDRSGFRPCASLYPLPLVGGDRAAKETWRMAISALYVCNRTDLVDRIAEAWRDIDRHKIKAVQQAIPYTKITSSSLGRLFDAISAILNISILNTYEGESAIRLEQACTMDLEEQIYPYVINKQDECWLIDTRPIIEGVVVDLLDSCPISVISMKFHYTIIHALFHATVDISKKFGIKTTALSGGAFQNRILLSGLVRWLKSNDIKVLTHSKFPTNDGGLALGQACAVMLYGADKLS